MKTFLALGISLTVLCPMHMEAVVKGSATVVSIEPFFTFPAADTDNTMLGFGWFKNGFALEDETTSCTFDGVYPVSGVVNLNGGTLYLLQDLELANILSLQGLGTIIGNGHSIDFCETITYMPSNLKVLQDVTVFMHGDLDLLGTFTIQGNCFIVCNNNKIDFEDEAHIFVDANSTLAIQGALLENVGGKISCVDDTGHIILNDVTCCIMSDWNFSHGDILFQQNVSLVGPAKLTYDSIMTCTIDDEAKVHLDGGLVLSIGSRDLSSHTPLYFYDEASILSCGECSLIVTNSGLNICRGRLELLKNVTLETPTTSSASGLIFGNGLSPEEDMSVVLCPGSCTEFGAGWITYNNTVGDKFYAMSPSARFLRTLDSKFCLLTTCTFPECNFEFEFDGFTIPQTLLAPGASLYYDNTRLIIPGIGDVTFKAYRQGPYGFVLEDGGSIFFTSGIFPGSVMAKGTGNMLFGNGSLSGAISLYDAASTLTCGLDGSIGGVVSLGGGFMYLYNDTYFTPGTTFATTGTIFLDRYMIDFGYKDFEFDVPINWISNGGSININADLSLTATWFINGYCTIIGSGNTLSLDEGGRIIVGPNSTLVLKGINLDVVDLADIECVDDTGLLVLDSVSWLQHSDFIFARGAMNFKNKVVMSGEYYSFVYQSVCTSTILPDSKLVLGPSFTFGYTPTIPSTDLIQFEDATSILKLNGATLYMGLAGMKLTRGILEIGQNSTIYGQTDVDEEGFDINEGLTVGNDNSEEDLSLVFNGDKVLRIANGALNYRNVADDSLVMGLMSSFVIGQGSILRLYQTMNMGNGTATFEQSSILAVASGKQLNGSVNAAGSFSIINL